jgi:hypothetical protein
VIQQFRWCERNDPEMNTNRTRRKRRGVKLVGAVLAGSAVVVAGALTVAFDGGGSGRANVLAGSGDAPTNTVFIQPTTSVMNVGATASPPSTPASTPAVSVAKPVVKAGS